MSKRTRPARRSSAGWAALMEAWKESGLSQTAFAEREGLNLGTFRWWAYRLGHGSRRAAAGEATKSSLAGKATFVPVHVRPSVDGRCATEAARPAALQSRSNGVEVVLTNGRRVFCDLAHVEDPRLAALLKLVEEVRSC